MFLPPTASHTTYVCGGRLKANEAEVFPETGGPPPPAFLAAGPQPIQPRMPMPPPPPMMAPTSTYVNPFLKKGQQPSTDTAPVTELPPGVTRPPTPPPSDNSCRHPSTAGRHVAFCKWWDRPKGFGFLGKEVDAPANDDDVYVQELGLVMSAR